MSGTAPPPPASGGPEQATGILSRELTPGTLRLEVRGAARPRTWAEVLAGWQEDDAFVGGWCASLAAAPFDAFFWESPPLIAGGLERPFECVLVNAPTLAVMRPEPEVFRAHFDGGGARGQGAVTFENLGGDALLVAPRPLEPPHAGAHLAAFCRDAPAAVKHELWREVGRRVLRELSAAPLWVSTSGLGVAWLHVRLDRQPKYYQHRPYRSLDRN